MNPILNQLMGATLNNNPFIQMFRMVMGTQNQNAMVQQLAQSNPQLRQTLDFINQNGGNAKELFYKMAQQKGKDPNTILNQLI